MIDYTKSGEEHIRYFIKLPILGWYEVDQETYRETAKKAMPWSAWGTSEEPDGFNKGTGQSAVEGYRITSRNGKVPPESYKTMNVPDAEEGQPEAPVIPPRVERRGSYIALVFPDGSYTDSMGVEDDDFEVLLSEAQYNTLVRAQTPVNLENIAAKVGARPVPEDSLRAALRDGVVEALQGVAKDMRAGVKRESPLKAATGKLRAVKDLLG